MPELPEVETVRLGLAPALEGRRIEAVELRRPDLRFPFPKDFAARLTGARVIGLGRRAKYLLADTDAGDTLIAHLGMSGRFELRRAAPDDARADPPHLHVLFRMEGGIEAAYHDPRRFGVMDLAPTNALERHAALRDLGPEPLGNAFSAPVLQAALERRRRSVKAALLDQRVVAGLGNIYVCEALHRARISPRRMASGLGARRIERIVKAVRGVLEEAIAAGGATLRDHAAVDGTLGYFQHAFAVYDRHGAPCPRGDGGVIARIRQGGRSSFYCGVCQR